MQPLYLPVDPTAHVVYSDNLAYLRLLSLESMSGTYYRGEVIAANIAGWITSGACLLPSAQATYVLFAEYHQAMDALDSVASQDVWDQYKIERTPASNIISEWAGQLPTVRPRLQL